MLLHHLMKPTPTPNDSLSQWLGYLEQLHPRGIDLGLDRVGEVYRRLGAKRPAPICITIGGTNGKGSTLAVLSSMLQQAGYRVGTYTSPHLLRYNERVQINGVEAADADLVDAFVRIDKARRELSLSYFEFATLAAFLLLADASLDVAVLEVGLGGRLDAVNLIDADAAVLTSVDLDHQEYLGHTRQQIGWDKAHIFRRNCPAVIAALDPPESVFQVAQQLGANAVSLPQIGAVTDAQWTCPLPDGQVLILPRPRLVAPLQPRNIAAAIWVWYLLRDRLPFAPDAARLAVAQTTLAGRLQRLPRAIETWVDVAHNGESARQLAAWVRAQPKKRSAAVFAALADKDLAAIVQPLVADLDHWIVLDLRPLSPRAADPQAQTRALSQWLPPEVVVTVASDMADALQLADAWAGEAGRILIFGSFITVAAALG